MLSKTFQILVLLFVALSAYVMTFRIIEEPKKTDNEYNVLFEVQAGCNQNAGYLELLNNKGELL